MVVFLSDHGGMFGQHGPFCGIKCQVCRAAMQVPLIIRHPARFAPQKTEAMVDVGTDMMPALLDLCGVTPPPDMHGQSYLPVLDGKTAKERDAIMYQVFTQKGSNPGESAPFAERGIRTKNWLYVRQEDRRVLLHDDRSDFHEQINLAGDTNHVALMDEFDARITAHMEATGKDWDMAADFPPDFLTHAEAKAYLANGLLPGAIHVP